MSKKKKSTRKTKETPAKPLRFAHPFFTPVPIAARPVTPGAGTHMTDYIQTKLLPVPPPLRDPTMTLDQIIGTQGLQEIQTAGTLIFQAAGDTGHENGTMQQYVADAMSADFDTARPEASPAFFLHLGDVIYYDNTDKGYQAQFYVPYKKYPGKIIAIPGNHDGELFKFDGTSTGQTTTLAAFQRNFCQPKRGVPSGAATIYREMVAQPGVYWWLKAPFIDIVALYSNVGEGPGFISGADIGQAQKNWLVKTLNSIKKDRAAGNRKALILAVHHPPFSEGGHSSSTTMLADLEDACTKAGIWPDAVLAAHSHNYQRFTRHISVNGKDQPTPYFVVGTGGRGTSPVVAATGQRTGDHSFDSSLAGYGYLTVKANASQLILSFSQVDASGKKSAFDQPVIIDLAAQAATQNESHKKRKK
ncbi:MAG TPA: metallophosphoesterase [Puia sp.]|nr:metallophosphoesterase [Puia sp.]